MGLFRFFRYYDVLPQLHSLYSCNCVRPGASSGILLGTTTLPRVMLARLIQLSRILPTDPHGPEGGFAWTFSTCCTNVTFTFGFTVELWGTKEHKQLRNRSTKKNSFCCVLCLIVGGAGDVSAIIDTPCSRFRGASVCLPINLDSVPRS